MIDVIWEAFRVQFHFPAIRKRIFSLAKKDVGYVEISNWVDRLGKMIIDQLNAIITRILICGPLFLVVYKIHLTLRIITDLPALGEDLIIWFMDGSRVIVGAPLVDVVNEVRPTNLVISHLPALR